MKFLPFISNDHSNVKVPDSENRHWYRLALMWSVCFINVAALVFGAQLGSKLTINETLLSTSVGGLILIVLAGFTAWIGAKTKLSTGMILKGSFGHVGANIASFLLAVTLFGWFAIHTEIFADSLQQLLQNIFNIELSKTILVVFGGVLMSSTAILGFRGLEKLSFLSAPIIIGILGLALFSLFGDGAFDFSNNVISGEKISIGAAIGSIVGTFMVGVAIMPDYMRYAKNEKHAVLGSTVGIIIGYPIFLMVSLLIGVGTNSADFIQIMLLLDFAMIAILLLVFSTWTTNDVNLYSSSMALSSIFQSVPRPVLATIGAALGIVLASIGLLSSFISWLILLGILVAPISGIYIVDFFNNPEKFIGKNKNKNFRWESFVSWFVGSSVGFSTTPSAYKGLDIFQITTVPPLDAFLISLIIMFFFLKLKKAA